VLSFGCSALGLWLMGGRVAAQLRDLGTHLPRQMQSLSAYLRHSSLFRQLLPGGTMPSQSPSAEQLVSGTAMVVSGTVAAIGGLVVVMFVGAYIAFEPRMYIKPLLSLAPPDRRDRLEQVAARLAHTLGRWLLGRIVAMVFVGVFTGTGLVLLKIPLALSLGVVAGVLAFVEYVGAVLSAVPAIALALTSSWAAAIWVSLLYLSVHLVEGYVLTPVLAKKAVHLPPAYTLAGQVIFGVLFGALGLTLSTPLIVVGVVLVQMFYVERALGEGSSASRVA
jgi:predicted PurR-regulated permease PerM